MLPNPEPYSNPVGYSYDDTFTYENCNNSTYASKGKGSKYMCGDTQYYEMLYVPSNSAADNVEGWAPLIDQPWCEPCPGKL